MMNETLATYANYALYSAVGVLTLAMIPLIFIFRSSKRAAPKDEDLEEAVVLE